VLAACPEVHKWAILSREPLPSWGSGRVVRLATALRAARSKVPGTLIRARLCHGNDGLVYVLTVLARDGKVTRLTVDAVKGSLVGGL